MILIYSMLALFLVKTAYMIITQGEAVIKTDPEIIGMNIPAYSAVLNTSSWFIHMAHILAASLIVTLLLFVLVRVISNILDKSYSIMRAYWSSVFTELCDIRFSSIWSVLIVIFVAGSFVCGLRTVTPLDFDTPAQQIRLYDNTQDLWVMVDEDQIEKLQNVLSEVRLKPVKVNKKMNDILDCGIHNTIEFTFADGETAEICIYYGGIDGTETTYTVRVREDGKGKVYLAKKKSTKWIDQYYDILRETQEDSAEELLRTVYLDPLLRAADSSHIDGDILTLTLPDDFPTDEVILYLNYMEDATLQSRHIEPDGGWENVKPGQQCVYRFPASTPYCHVCLTVKYRDHELVVHDYWDDLPAETKGENRTPLGTYIGHV